MTYRQLRRQVLHLNVLVFIHSSSCVLNFVLPECRPNFAEVTRSTFQVTPALRTISLYRLTGISNEGHGRNNDRAKGGPEHLEIIYETECRK